MRRSNFPLLRRLLLICALLISLLPVYVLARKAFNPYTEPTDLSTDDNDDLSVPPAVVVTQQELDALPSITTALPANIVIADRGNNRLIEVTPDKKIAWELDFNDLYPNLRPGYGADDAFFTPSGQTLMVNLEAYHLIAEIDYATKQVIWEYGHPGKLGSAPGYLNTPDDAYRWPDGLTSVADIRNCRVVFLNQQKEIVRQFGKIGQCLDRPGYYNKPNGDTPLPNGNTLVSVIQSHEVIEVQPDGSEVYRLSVPLAYPSDAQKLDNGDILVADYVSAGKVIEITLSGEIVWQYYFPTDPERGLNHPSLAIQLPSKNILLNDDGNHRVIVIDYQTKQIIWQYGVTHKPGRAPGQLSVPDGLDLHLISATLPQSTPMIGPF